MQVTSMASQGSLSGQQLELRPVVDSDLAVLRDAWLQLDWVSLPVDRHSFRNQFELRS